MNLICFYFRHRIYKSIILLIFTCITCASIYFIPSIDIGLDQQLSMPKTSYVYKYFQVSAYELNLGKIKNIHKSHPVSFISFHFIQVMGELLSMGPPVYFVLSTKLQLNEIPNQNLLCGGPGCNQDSVITKIHLASTNSDVYVVSWIFSHSLQINSNCEILK